MKQFEANKKEYVAKLKHELDTVEHRFHKVINENNMIGEDIRSRALFNLEKMLKAEGALKVVTDELEQTTNELNLLKKAQSTLTSDYAHSCFESEDYQAKFM